MRGLDPVALVLEGVGGEGDPARIGVEFGPIDGLGHEPAAAGGKLRGCFGGEAATAGEDFCGVGTAQELDGLGDSFADEEAAVIKGAAARLEGEGDVAEIEAGIGFEMGGEICGGGVERGAGPGGEDEDLRRSGASSTMTWALVPPTPKELTPARRGRPLRCQGRDSVLTKKGLFSKSICGFGFVKCSDGGRMPFSSASVVLMRPVTPEATSRWPKFVFAEPMAQNCFLSVPARKAWVSAATSMGSPRGVAVPWAST